MANTVEDFLMSGDAEFDNVDGGVNISGDGTETRGGDPQSIDIIDDLSYFYKPLSNQLMEVGDVAYDEGFIDGSNTGDDYAYDMNGNMVLDRNKQIAEIRYNHLNLPTYIRHSDQMEGRLSFVYSATGEKLKKIFEIGDHTPTSYKYKETLYAGNFIYERYWDYTTPYPYPPAELKMSFHPEGYLQPVDPNDYSQGFEYVYSYTDHLGNVRLSYSDMDNDGIIDPATEILQERNYYPFGLEHKGYNSSVVGAENNHKTYQGKELEKELGRNIYDFGWRNFDPAIARWTTIDPLAERRYELTPYNFVQNSPMFRIDPYGLTDYTLNKETGEVSQVGDTNDDPDRILKTDKNGNVKRKGEGFLGFLVKKSERGKAKVAIGGIEQGILSDGMNLKNSEGNLIEVGGEGQASVGGVEMFALELSEYVGTEIGGMYFSRDGAKNTTHISIGGYEDNSLMETNSYGIGSLRNSVNTIEEFNSFSARGFFHTHPSGIDGTNPLRPSPQDRDMRDNQLRSNPNLMFFLLTRPVNSNGKSIEKIPYH